MTNTNNYLLDHLNPEVLESMKVEQIKYNFIINNMRDGIEFTSFIDLGTIVYKVYKEATGESYQSIIENLKAGKGFYLEPGVVLVEDEKGRPWGIHTTFHLNRHL